MELIKQIGIEKDLDRVLYETSLVDKGDTLRIEKMFEKAENGQDITIAFFGGGITEGISASLYKRCFAELVTEWFRNKFKKSHIHCINAGLSNTGSLIGVHRVKKCILQFNPDLVFVDAAVNDNGQSYCRISYESLIKQILESSTSPAVIELFMTFIEGHNYEKSQAAVGKNYNLPMISFKNAAVMLVEKYGLEWDEILIDEALPNDFGHKIISELIIDYLENVYAIWEKRKIKDEIKPKEISEKECVYGDRYMNGRILSGYEIKPVEKTGFEESPWGFQIFHNCWKYKSEEAAGEITFNVKCRNLVLLYKKIISEDAGIMKIYIDDNKPLILDTHFRGGRGDYAATEILCRNDEEQEHKIKIEVLKEEREREVTILGLMVS